MKTQALFAITMKQGKKPKSIFFSDVWVNRKELDRLYIFKMQDTFLRTS